MSDVNTSGSRSLSEFRRVEDSLRSHEFNRQKIQGITKLTESPISLENYSYAYYYLSKKFQKSSNLKILDMGCFVGLFVDFLQKQGYPKTYGIDSSKKFIAAGRKLKIKGLLFADARFASQKFEKGFFDIIFSVQMIHNDYSRPIPEIHDLVLAVFNEAYLLLNSGGIFFLNTYVDLPLEKIHSAGFKQINRSFSSKTKNFIFKKMS